VFLLRQHAAQRRKLFLSSTRNKTQNWLFVLARDALHLLGDASALCCVELPQQLGLIRAGHSAANTAFAF
jgi:hypothetical protein